MVIEREHNLPPETIKQRLDAAVDGLLHNMPGGVSVSNVRRQWHGNELHFSATASKRLGPFSKSVDIGGRVLVTDHTARLETEVPAIVKSLVGEDRIRDVIEQQFDRHVLKA